MSAPLRAGMGVAEGSRGPFPPQIFRTSSNLCFERRHHKQNSIIRLKSKILDPTKFFGPPKFLAGYGTARRGKLPNFGADCFTVGLYLVIITWQ